MSTEKITLIIIDDDFASRNTIKNYLRTSQIYFIVDDFSNAITALDWLKDNKVDIAICDMNMPNIDGIEFINRALTFCPDLRFLAVSVHSDFRYLRECMIHSVEDYLLKQELSADLLINTLDKIKEKYNMRPASIYSTNSLHIIEEESQFTLDRIKILIKEGSINFKADAVIPAIISPDYKNEYFSDYTTFSSHVVYAIMDIICDVLDNKYSYIVFKNSSSQFVMLLSFTKNERLQPDKIRKLLIFIKDKILRLLNITITIAYSNSIMYLETAMDILVCLKSFRENKLYLSPGGLYKLGEISKLIADNYYLASFIKEQIKTLIELKDFSTLKDKIHNIFANMQNNQIRRDKVIEITEQIKDSIDYCILQYNSNKTTGRINFYDFEFILQYEMAITHYIDELSKDIIGLSNQLYSTSISRALSYIENNYKKAISLEGCAVDAGVSYTHLSRIFKKETSLSFSEYLNRFRLSKAKIFLAEKRIPIKQIVEEVGFSNYNYFFKVFKEIEGITPIEFVDEANN